MKAVSTPDGQWYLADAFGHKVSDWISEDEAKRLAAEKNGTLVPKILDTEGGEFTTAVTENGVEVVQHGTDGDKPDKPRKK